MAVITLGSPISPTVLGGEASVTTGTEITTLPVSSPVAIFGSGNHADSYWQLSTTTLLPEDLTYKVGLGAVADGALTDHILLYDADVREIKKIDGTGVAAASHTHAWSAIVSGKPTTLSGYGITDLIQPLDNGLTSISGLSYVSPSFVKMTGVDTFTLDTNTYSTTSHNHDSTYEPVLGNPGVNGYILASDTSGNRSWVAQISAASVITDHGDLTGLSDNDHPQYAFVAAPTFTTSFGFSSWRFVLNGSVLEIKYNGVLKGSLASTGDLSCVGDVVAYSV